MVSILRKELGCLGCKVEKHDEHDVGGIAAEDQNKSKLTAHE